MLVGFFLGLDSSFGEEKAMNRDFGGSRVGGSVRFHMDV